MTEKAAAMPEVTHTITAHIAVSDAVKAIEFYQQAFGAEPLFVHKMPNGKVMHASVKIGDSRLMLADEIPARGFPSPTTLGGTPVFLNIQVEDVDALWKRALDARAKVIFPLANQFWGDRYGQVVDPFGHKWALLSHVEDVPQEEMARRANAIFAEMAKKAGA